MVVDLLLRVEPQLISNQFFGLLVFLVLHPVIGLGPWAIKTVGRQSQGELLKDRNG